MIRWLGVVALAAAVACGSGSAAADLVDCASTDVGRTPPPDLSDGYVQAATERLSDRFGLGAVEPSGIVSGRVGFTARDGWTQELRREVAPLLDPARSCAAEFTNGPNGPEVASWELAPGSVPTPESTRLETLVLEEGCASGQTAQGRIIHDVKYREDAVVVRFRVVTLGAATCPSHPPTRHVITLDEPLGDRELLDGAVAPYRPPQLDVPGPP
jgi:hypothetical protein